MELYPNPGLIPAFLEKIRRNETLTKWVRPRVFVTSVFEIEANTTLPETKDELVQMLKNNTAVPFHNKICPECHSVPKSDEWMKAPVASKKPWLSNFQAP